MSPISVWPRTIAPLSQGHAAYPQSIIIVDTSSGDLVSPAISERRPDGAQRQRSRNPVASYDLGPWRPNVDARRLRTVLASGLTSQQAQEAMTRHGPNALPTRPPESLWRKVVRAVRDPLVLVLLAAAALTILTADFTDAVVIGLVVIVNTTVAVRQEVGAEKALAALRSMASPMTRVLRDGVEQELLVELLVPGDLVIVGEGDLVPADGSIVEAAALRVNEATLTGESVPVDKRVALGENDSAADAHLLSGTAVVHGRARMRVERTGANSAG